MNKSPSSQAAEAAKRDAHRAALAKQNENSELDEALRESFPASDPPSQTQPKTSVGTPRGHQKKH